ncbi:hypothetical protein NBRC116188_02140 [Oceaniserpentilla sp. 4NH20-0058]|uniref:GNAT family N-acetyltransferase n=1 Tax=Oceaniserpentilla sp. 4NH20-0058 TaxID=3127660 RepID=UPI003101BB1A
MSQIKIKQTCWSDDKDILQEIRNQVFIQEQRVPAELEWDDLDNTAKHWLGFIDDTPVACARLLSNGKIGRMAVLKPFRKMGLGSLLLESIIAQQDKPFELHLSAQCHAFSFYLSNGFSACSAPYDDASIPHIDMQFSDTLNHKYQLGNDSSLYHGSTLLEAKGYLDLILTQTTRSIIVMCNDLCHAILASQSMSDCIKKQCKLNKHFRVYLLVKNFSQLERSHNLLNLLVRLPTYFHIRQSKENLPNQILFDSTAWLDYENNTYRVNFSDRSKIKLTMERFNTCWHSAKLINDIRPLSI